MNEDPYYAGSDVEEEEEGGSEYGTEEDGTESVGTGTTVGDVDDVEDVSVGGDLSDEDEEDEDEGEDEEEDDEEGDDASTGGAKKNEEKKGKGKGKEKGKRKKNKSASQDDNDDDDEEMEMDMNKYYQKIHNTASHQDYIQDTHPEILQQNSNEIMAMLPVIRDEEGIVSDPLHRTLPFLTKYEKARILGQRTKQIESGATPFVAVPDNMIDAYLIAEMELKQKKIPFIVRRPLPHGSTKKFECWDIDQLTIL